MIITVWVWGCVFSTKVEKLLNKTSGENMIKVLRILEWCSSATDQAREHGLVLNESPGCLLLVWQKISLLAYRILNEQTMTAFLSDQQKIFFCS